MKVPVSFCSLFLISLSRLVSLFLHRVTIKAFMLQRRYLNIESPAATWKTLYLNINHQWFIVSSDKIKKKDSRRWIYQPRKKTQTQRLVVKNSPERGNKTVTVTGKKKFGNHWIQGPRFCDCTVAGLNPVECWGSNKTSHDCSSVSGVNYSSMFHRWGTCRE